MSIGRLSRLAMYGTALALCTFVGTGLPVLADAASSATAVSDSWPRVFRVPDGQLQVYQPQVESWQGNELRFRAAVAATRTGSSEETFGVIWATTRTEVDPVTRQVVLRDLRLTRSRFPTLADDGAAYRHELQEALPKGDRTISLDRLEASLAADGKVDVQHVKVDNKPPRIIVSYAPAVLIPIDGEPVLRAVPGSWFERVLNTQALIIRESGHKTFYLHLYDGWVSADGLDGHWTRVRDLPPGADELAKELAKSGKVDLLDGGPAKPSLDHGVPVVHVSETPTELVVFKGQPDFQPIGTTDLLWAANTTSDVLFDTGDNQFYMLISGRWFRAASAAGPLSYVPSTELPASFHEIPTSSPAGVVLASVAGTPQAQEMVIENSIARTADVTRSKGAAFTASYDGAPKLRSILGTPLEHVVNSPNPVIRIDAHTYYALENGIWFEATSAEGPWVVAASVPAVIYTIPPSSSLHYVTYVKIYGSTPEVVYEGYTPGYLGTVVAPDGVVVYGTGYDYQPYVGTSVYYPPPVTYGVQAQPVYNPAVGWASGAALGLTTAALVDSWGDHNNNNNNNYYHDYYSPVYHGYPCCSSTSANVYGSWAHGATSGNETWSVDSSGKATEKYSGSYTDYATGTTGHINAQRSYNPYNGNRSASTNRTVNTPEGTSGDVQRSASYNPESGKSSYSASGSATGREGGTAEAQRNDSYNAQTGTSTEKGSASATGPEGASREASASHSYDAQTGQSSGTAERTKTAEGGSSVTHQATGSDGAASHETTVDNAKTGESHTYDTGGHAHDYYAGSDGNVYRHDNGGWQQHSSNGWHGASSNTGWANREQQARSQGADRASTFSEGGWGDRSGGGGGGWGGRFGGGGGFRR